MGKHLLSLRFQSRHPNSLNVPGFPEIKPGILVDTKNEHWKERFLPNNSLTLLALRDLMSQK